MEDKDAFASLAEDTSVGWNEWVGGKISYESVMMGSCGVQLKSSKLKCVTNDDIDAEEEMIVCWISPQDF